MKLDSRRTRLWSAMGLGPLWSLRSSSTKVQKASSLPIDAVVQEPGRSQRVLRMDWSELELAVAQCEACSLSQTRTRTVFGVGNRTAEWMLVGEAPGAEEDARGEPFVGQAGRLLDNMLAALGLSRGGADRDAVFIANVLKCRPPGNRNPEPREVQECEPFLQRQIELVNPKIVLVMGRFAAQSLLGSDASIASLRGKVHRIDIAGRKVAVVVTYHPAYLLRNLGDKAKSWADLCLARGFVERGS